MELDAGGVIRLNDVVLYMGMPEQEFHLRVPGFTGNKIFNRNNEITGYLGYLPKHLGGHNWELSVQVNVKQGLVAFYARYIGGEYAELWLGPEKEKERKEIHRNFLQQTGLKQKHYAFGYIRCSMNKKYERNDISLVYSPKE